MWGPEATFWNDSYRSKTLLPVPNKVNKLNKVSAFSQVSLSDVDHCIAAELRIFLAARFVCDGASPTESKSQTSARTKDAGVVAMVPRSNPVRNSFPEQKGIGN